MKGKRIIGLEPWQIYIYLSIARLRTGLCVLNDKDDIDIPED